MQGVWNHLFMKRNSDGIASDTLIQISVDSFAAGEFERKFRQVNFVLLILDIDGFGISCKIGVVWLPMDIIDDK